jgi:superfamily II DNA or RNA helicase
MRNGIHSMDKGTQKPMIKQNSIIQGSLFSEPVQVILSEPRGNSIKIVGRGLKTGLVHEKILSIEQIQNLEISPEKEPFNGDATRFRLGIEAMRLGLAYEYDPYFTLSIARVDPLPHQLEAVYDYFLKLPRIRFLLADDPGAGKTIMAGLLLKELKIRGLIKRILIVTPANLTFQWQREMKDRFRENFDIIRSDLLRATYGSNPWQERNQVITSLSWVSIVEDAKESLLRSHWDLIIVDEAHKMSAYSQDHKTLAYQLGESLSQMTDHFLLMTATPHKGDPENFRLFLELLDKDVYGDIKSLEEAMRSHNAPFYLRRVKEALVLFPDPETGVVKTLFTKRNVQTTEFEIDSEEWEFYDALTKYVEEQSMRAAGDDSARGRAVGFTMALLQRRFASSIYAVRRTLERMKESREKALHNPDEYRKKQISRRLPDDFYDLTEEEQYGIVEELEKDVPTLDPSLLREDIRSLQGLIDQARILEKREIESKLIKLKVVLTQQGIFSDPKMKLLIFTEHKDTLEFLVGKLREWGLTVTQIHGGMKIGDQNAPNTRIFAEREFKESCQIMVATEAAGEGINLQFCWFMINYDIPWNPMRLEQRMGRIHRYGQEKDCLIINFVSTNTREGRVLFKLFERIHEIENDLDPKRTGKIFNVLGEIFPANQLEKMVREMYARNLTEDIIKSRIVEQVDVDRFRKITSSTLEGLAKRELNLSAILSKSAEAKERRLIPEVIEDFFIQSGSVSGVTPKEIKKDSHIYRVGRVPRNLWQTGECQESRFGKLSHEYKNIVFDKKILASDPTLEWVTPGHSLFECVREYTSDNVQHDLRQGAVFYDLHRKDPARLDVFSAAIQDGRGNILHKRLFVVETSPAGTMTVRQPTIFLDISPAPVVTPVPDVGDLPTRDRIEHTLIEQSLNGFLEEIQTQRTKETERIAKHVEISLNELIHRQNLRMAELIETQQKADDTPFIAANIKTTEDRLFELNERLERRLKELAQERQCSIADIQHHGCAWVLPHPERASPGLAAMVRDDEIEKIAIKKVIEAEEAKGWIVRSVESENRGFDLISRKPHPEDPETSMEVRFIEVKGRAGVGEIALSSNEYKTAERLRKDFWLYVVYNCGLNPEIHQIQDPARLGWEPLVTVEHYHIAPDKILNPST